MLDYFTPFSYLFKDRGWFRKFIIASLLTVTLVGAAPVFGWTISIVRRVTESTEPPMPEWKDWRLFWKLGGKFALVNAIWLLPLLLAVLLLYLPLILANRLQAETMLAVFGGTLFCVLGFLFIYAIVYSIFFPAMLVVLAKGGSVWQAINPLHLWKITRSNFTGYLLVFIIVGMALVNIVLILSAFTLFLLLPPLLVYALLVTAHYAGQLGRSDQSPRIESVQDAGQSL